MKPTDTQSFLSWFGDSKVVDADGLPLVVYHGTASDVSEFSKQKIGSIFNSDKAGFFFSSEPDTASEYAVYASSGGWMNDINGANVMPVFVSIKNPFTLEDYKKATNSGIRKSHGDGVDSLTRFFDDDRSFILRFAKENKRDGIVFDRDGKKLVVAFHAEQVKSAIGNSGLFNSACADITDGAGGKESAPVLRKQWNAIPATGRHSGTIKAVSDTEVIQHIGQEQYVVWPLQNLSGTRLEVGQMVDISADGQVKSARSKDNGLSI